MQMPSLMLYINGIAMKHMNPGIASVKSAKSIFEIDFTIIKPTRIKAGAVAKDGIAKKIGDKIIDIKNNNPVVIAVKPVLPPEATPEALSTKVVVVDVPKIAPTTVAIASARRAPFIRGNLPSLSSILASVDTPISVPSVSNISTNKKENIITMKLNVKILFHSNLKKVEAILILMP